MAKPLTPISIAALKPRALQYEISDGGCAGLRVVVFPSRRKSFIVRYRFRGHPSKLTLGPCLIGTHVEPAETPAADTPLSLAAAREMCARALRQAKAGNDPAADKRNRKQAERAAASDTLKAIGDEWLRRQGAGLRSVNQRKADLALLNDTLGALPLEQITKGQFVRVLDRIEDTRGAVRSHRVQSALKTLLTWHAGRSDYVSVLQAVKARIKISEHARSRVLSDDELRAVVTTAERFGLFGDYLLFTLLTATRRNESADLHRGELQNNGAVWTIPAIRYKNKRDTLIPLSTAAQAIVARQPQLGDFVFSSTGERGLTDFSARKAAFDKACGASGWVIHDLRRTARTLLSRAGINTDIAEMCLGHVAGGVRWIYDRHAYEKEKAAAFEALAVQIEHIVRPPPAKVADIAAERRRRRPA